MRYNLRKVRILLLLQIGCFLIGGSLIARPAARLARRKLVEWKSGATWSAWKKDARPSRPGDPIAWLTAADARLNHLVLNGATKDNLAKAPCWSAQAASPGQPGLKIIEAHRDTHFNRLGGLEAGSEIALESLTGKQRYRVVDIEIMNPFSAKARLASSREQDRLALVTCYPFHYFGPAPQRCLVWAAPI
jgi:sortase A